ncbi:hypothetical protein E2C01_036210 [Portunus trituberculatus]|uniref:Uncharacterized protein n=1 Tax=Portunus trituberculatus TaxID=210409 RepID=A0A5B7FAL6_PORTR|nr:hypothetical protein [Portunus trituberculatus]
MTPVTVVPIMQVCAPDDVLTVTRDVVGPGQVSGGEVRDGGRYGAESRGCPTPGVPLGGMPPLPSSLHPPPIQPPTPSTHLISTSSFLHEIDTLVPAHQSSLSLMYTCKYNHLVPSGAAIPVRDVRLWSVTKCPLILLFVDMLRFVSLNPVSNLLLLLADTSRLSTFPAHFAPVLLQTGSPDKVMGQWAGPSPPSPLVTAGQGSAQHTATPAVHPLTKPPYLPLLPLLRSPFPPSQSSLSILQSCDYVRQVHQVLRQVDRGRLR